LTDEQWRLCGKQPEFHHQNSSNSWYAWRFHLEVPKHLRRKDLQIVLRPTSPEDAVRQLRGRVTGPSVIKELFYDHKKYNSGFSGVSRFPVWKWGLLCRSIVKRPL
jgi:hypothetical protein